MRTEGRTDLTKLIVAFHNSAKGPVQRVFRVTYDSQNKKLLSFLTPLSIGLHNGKVVCFL